MPELPEVETIRRGLEPHLVGQTIARVDQRRPDLRFPFPENFAARLEGQTVHSLSRRSKYLLLRTAKPETLLIHLGMTGRFSIRKDDSKTVPGAFTHETGAIGKHDHVVFSLLGNTTITYNDVRRFGFMVMVPDVELETHPLLASLGVEPLGNGFNAAYIAKRAQLKSVDLKTFLMDQSIIAGLGNIYVCEALHRAGLSPSRPAATLASKRGTPTQRCERLAAAIIEVLRDALAAGGSTLRDYRQAGGEQGYFQHTFFVYGRAGEPCRRSGCKGEVQRIVTAGRSTFFCSSCQK